MSVPRTIVYTAGVFDRFHEGHLNLLERSRDLAGPSGLLIVGVLTDAGASLYKPTPRFDQVARLRMVSGRREVSSAFLQPTTDPSPVLLALDALGLRPRVMTHGSDWEELREGGGTLQRLGIEFVLLPYTPGISSSMLAAEERGRT